MSEEENIQNQEQNDSLQIYEAGFIVDQTLPDAGVQEAVTAIKKAISDLAGSIISEEAPKKRDLAYTIIKSEDSRNKRYSSGFFGWVKFEIAADKIASIKLMLEGDRRIVRFLLIKTVRENTLVYQRAPFIPRVDGERPVKREAPKVQEGATPSPISETELDKSIEKLIV